MESVVLHEHKKQRQPGLTVLREDAAETVVTAAAALSGP